MILCLLQNYLNELRNKNIMKNVKAKKYLGQHFLKNKSIAEKITDLLNIKNTELIEIGPGMGVLTQFLLKKYNPILIEIDKESVTYLNKKYPKLKHQIINEDFLKLNLKKYDKNISLIGNFPYNISSQILFKILENRNQIFEVVGMFQKEVAERIVAKKGRKRGILSVLLQSFYNIEYCLNVNKEEFYPIPKVESGVIKFTKNNRDSLNCDELLFKKIVKTSFNQRRKTLRNALKPFTLLQTNNIKNLLNLRAEELSVDEFITITKNVKGNKNK